MIQGPNTPPTMTDDEYTIHALNIHSTFFERKCQHVVNQSKDWKVIETNYPVTSGNQNSNLDIWAERGKGRAQLIELPIECKKNNPDFIDWIFFLQPTHRPSSSTI